MGFLKSIAKGFGNVSGAAKDAAGSLYDAITGRNDAASQAAQAGQTDPSVGDAGQAGQSSGQAAAAMMGGQGGSPAEQAGASSGSAAAAMMGGQGSSPAEQAGASSGSAAAAMFGGQDASPAEQAGAAVGADASGAFSKQEPAGSAVAPCPAAAAAAAPDVLSAAAQDRGNQKYETLSPADKSLFSDTVKNAGSDRERAYIWKAFAACHTPRECATFAARIRGRDPAWMKDKLSLTGDSSGRGVRQQWSHSCNATTVQAVRGQMDPIYALDTHDANPNFNRVNTRDATKLNPKLAEEQRQMLTSTYHGAAAGDHAGVAAGRGQTGGSGRWADDLLNQRSDETGVQYTTKKRPADPVTDIDNGLKTGAPVPIVIGNAPGEYTHYVLVTGSAKGPPKTYTIHDPWAGKTVQRSEADLKDGRIDLAGSNKVTAIEVPTPIVKAAGRPPC